MAGRIRLALEAVVRCWTTVWGDLFASRCEIIYSGRCMCNNCISDLQYIYIYIYDYFGDLYTMLELGSMSYQKVNCACVHLFR